MWHYQDHITMDQAKMILEEHGTSLEVAQKEATAQIRDAVMDKDKFFKDLVNALVIEKAGELLLEKYPKKKQKKTKKDTNSSPIQTNNSN